MNLGFIESKTYDEISVGDIARTEHVLTLNDAMAFASISGFDSVLSQEELIERAGGVPPTGPNMWCASLISGLFSMNIPGPGCTLTNVSLSFPRPHSSWRPHSCQRASNLQGRRNQERAFRLPGE